MILFLSDAHLGRSGNDRLVEADLISCLKSHRSRVEHLYLLGDLFDEYIEYRHLIPKGFVRLKGLLADWTDAGIPVTYLVGNHDPWHRDYFESELGITMQFDGLSVQHRGCDLFLAHGDRTDAEGMLEAWWKDLLRHPVPVWLYKSLLPGDWGFALARYVNRTFGKRELNPDLVEQLRVHARQILANRAVDVVVFGHSHYPELLTWPEGFYLNTGYWHESRTFGRLDDDALQLVRWNGACSEVVETQMLTS